MRFHSSVPPGKSVCQLYHIPKCHQILQFYSVLFQYLPGKLLTVPNIPIMSSIPTILDVLYQLYIFPKSSTYYSINLETFPMYHRLIGDIPSCVPNTTRFPHG